MAPHDDGTNPTVSATVAPAVKVRLREEAHRQTDPGRNNVTEADLIREALRNYLQRCNESPETVEGGVSIEGLEVAEA